MRLAIPNKFLFAIPLAFMIFFIYLFNGFPEESFFVLEDGTLDVDKENHFLWGEQGVIEVCTALLYFFSIIIAILGIIRKNKKLNYFFYGWLVLCVAFLGEETSWFQHILGFETPKSVAEVNQQEEFNLHNLKWFHQTITPDGSKPAILSTDFLLKAQNLFRFGFFTYFLLIPGLCFFQWGKNLLNRFSFPCFHSSLFIYIWVPIIFSFALAAFSIGAYKSTISETRELYYALSIFTYLTLLYLLAKNTEPLEETS